jgi:pimeloyl-ACP methyl ester carboxylesterase
MGDPSLREVITYIPPNVDTAGLKTVYFLPGWGSRGSKFLQDSEVFGQSFLHRLEAAVSSKEIYAFVSVFVDGSSTLGCHQYINSASLGPVQDWIAEDLPQLIETRYGCSAKASDRIVAGHSSGGFGALWLGLQRPDRFQRIVAAAADSFFEISILSHLLGTWQELTQRGGIEGFLQYFKKHPQPQSLGSRSFLTMLTLSLAPCYSPRTSPAPLFGELFFDLQTGQIREEIWEEYLRWDPIRGVTQTDSKKLENSFFVLDCGTEDEYGAQLGHRQIAEKMTHQGISHHLMEFSGKHSGNDWRYIERLKHVFKFQASGPIS